MPDLSVVITNFQRPQFLWEAFQSCVRASVPSIVISSSGTTREVETVHLKILSARPDTIIVSEKGDSGNNANWLSGVRSARSKWVTLLHDDDLLMEDYASSLLPRLENGAGFHLWDARRHGMGFKDIYPILDQPTGLHPSEILFRNLLIRDYFTISPTVGCFQRDDLVSILEECATQFADPFYHTKPTLMIGNDLWIWLRSIQKHARLGYIKQPLTSYGHHPGSATCDEVFQKRGKFASIYNRVRAQFAGNYRSIIHVTPIFRTLDRETRRRNDFAARSWQTLYKSGLYQPLHNLCGKRDSRIIGDRRRTPFLKDVLDTGRQNAKASDIILLTNNDTVLHSDLTRHLLAMMREEEAVCAFRQGYDRCPDLVSLWNPNLANQPHDSGRDLFAFTRAWLDVHWTSIPDYVLGASDWDSTLATLIRISKNIDVDSANWIQRHERCELPTGLIHHERHAAFWATPQNRVSLPGNSYNRNLTKHFIASHGKGWFM